MHTKIQHVDEISYGLSQYKLIASILHDSDNADKGHYVAYVKDRDGVKKFDDNGSGIPRYGPASEEFEKVKEDSYILFYEKIQR